RIHLAYQLAQFFVLATLGESFALPIVEAMACGCPVIAPTTGACHEIGGDAIRLIDPYDVDGIAARLLEFERDPELRTQLARDGLERARRFTWRSTAERTLAVFDMLSPPHAGAVPAT